MPPPNRLLPQGWIPAYLEYTNGQASPTMFHLWVAISTIAGTLKRNVYLDRGGYYQLFPNMYTVLVGPAGGPKKSTAASLGIRLLNEIDGSRILREKLTPEGLIRFFEEGAIAKKQDAEGTKFLIGSDVFVFAPELSVFLSSASYNNGLIELLTTVYENPPEFQFTTKGAGQKIVPNPGLNILGASNPEWLAKGVAEDSFGGGFMGRTVFVFQESGRKVAWPKKSDEMEALKLPLLADLGRMAQLRGAFSVSPEAEKIYEDWYNKHEVEGGRMSGYYQRKPDHVLKLAMILSASFDDSLRIETPYMHAAFKMLEDVELTMEGAFAFIGVTNEARISNHIVSFITSCGGGVERKKLFNKVRHLVRGTREFDDIMHTLVEAEVLVTHTENRVKFYFIPATWELLCAKRAEKDEEDRKAQEQALEEARRQYAEQQTGQEKTEAATTSGSDQASEN